MARKKKRRSEETPAPAEEVAQVDTETAVIEAEPSSEPAEEPVAAEHDAAAETGEVSTEAEGSEAAAEIEVDVDALLGDDIPPAPDAESDEPAMATEEPTLRYQLKQVLEAVMFASQKPLSVKEIVSILKGAAEADKENPASHATPFAKVKEPQLRAAIEELELEYSDPNRSFEVRESAAGWQLVTKPDFSPWLRQLFPENRSARLSAPAMETLAIIAYRQPITRADIEAVRGVAVDGVMQTLLDRGLIKIDGRAEIPGRPLLYGTTQNFMEHFGLKNLDDLPNAGELRKISLPTAEPPPPDTPAPAAETSEAAVPAAEEGREIASEPTATETSEAPPMENSDAATDTDPTAESADTEPPTDVEVETSAGESAPEDEGTPEENTSEETQTFQSKTEEPVSEESAPDDQESESSHS